MIETQFIPAWSVSMLLLLAVVAWAGWVFSQRDEQDLDADEPLAYDDKDSDYWNQPPLRWADSRECLDGQHQACDSGCACWCHG